MSEEELDHSVIKKDDDRWTVIRIQRETRIRFQAALEKGETYDTFIRHLFDMPVTDERASRYGFTILKGGKLHKWFFKTTQERDRIYWAAKKYALRNGWKIEIHLFVSHLTAQRVK